MSDKYVLTIGLEIHVELLTKQKIFSPAINNYQANPNLNIDPTTIALPGAMPVFNPACLPLALYVCDELKMKVDQLVRFDRKNYYYLDLPKGFQITQHFNPLGTRGELVIEIANGLTKNCGVSQLFLEEDTAKRVIDDSQKQVKLDYNRSGVPLIEIVSEPCFKNSQEVIAYLTAIRQILVYGNVSDARMENGSMRCDVNISIAAQNSLTLGNRVEVKNLNSFKNVSLAINYEFERQKSLLDTNQEVKQETRNWDEKNKITRGLRRKMSQVDYRFIREPNLLPIVIPDEYLVLVRSKYPKSVTYYRNLFANAGINNEQIISLLDHPSWTKYLAEVISLKNLGQSAYTFFVNNLTKIDLAFFPPRFFVMMLDLIKQKQFTSKEAQTVLKELLKSKRLLSAEEFREFVNKKEFASSKIQFNLKQIIVELVKEHVRSQNDLAKKSLLRFLLGQVMRITGGKANAKEAMSLITEQLKKVTF